MPRGRPRKTTTPKPTKALKELMKVEPPRIRSIDSTTVATTVSNDIFIIVDKISLQMRLAPKMGLPNPGSLSVTICNLEQLHDLSPEFLKNKIVMKASSYVHLEKLTEVVDVKSISIIDYISKP